MPPSAHLILFMSLLWTPENVRSDVLQEEVDYTAGETFTSLMIEIPSGIWTHDTQKPFQHPNLWDVI